MEGEERQTPVLTYRIIPILQHSKHVLHHHIILDPNHLGDLLSDPSSQDRHIDFPEVDLGYQLILPHHSIIAGFRPSRLDVAMQAGKLHTFSEKIFGNLVALILAASLSLNLCLSALSRSLTDRWWKEVWELKRTATNSILRGVGASQTWE